MKKEFLILPLLILVLTACDQGEPAEVSLGVDTSVTAGADESGLEVAEEVEEVVETDEASSTEEVIGNEVDQNDEEAPEAAYETDENMKEGIETALSELQLAIDEDEKNPGADNYEDFIGDVTMATYTLREALESDEMPDSMENFISIRDQLNVAVQRGDAELAPSYEEFKETVHQIESDFEDHFAMWSPSH